MQWSANYRICSLTTDHWQMGLFSILPRLANVAAPCYHFSLVALMIDRRQVLQRQAKSIPAAALLQALLLASGAGFIARGQQAPTLQPAVLAAQQMEIERSRTEIPMDDGQLAILYYDRLESPEKRVLVANGHVHLVYGDIQVWADRVEYRQESGDLIVEGNIRFLEKLQQLTCSRAHFNLKTKLGSFWDASGITQGDLHIQAGKVDKIAEQRYTVENGFITACRDRIPKWSFKIGRGTLELEKSISAAGSWFKIKGLPVFYTPWFKLPVDRRQRSSGFLLPSYGNSTSKGRTFAESFYLTLGRSADATISFHYFSKRGEGYGFNLRTRPDARSHLNISNFYVHDKLGNGGSNFVADGEIYTQSGFRGVADLDLVTDFAFRQNFTDTFHRATNPQGNSVVFLSNNFGTNSFNIIYNRQETFFPEQSVLIRNAPSFSFKSLGKTLDKIPFVVSMDSSLESLQRKDSFLETPTFVQRMDFFPQISLPLKRWAGLSLTPRLGFRETFYSETLDPAKQGGVSGDNLNRQYLLFETDLNGPALERIFRHGTQDWFKHLIEPQISYRRIKGIDSFSRVIRFDEKDVVTDTNEIEYSLVNRIFVHRMVNGYLRTQEFLSWKISQQHFFDTSFGGDLTVNTAAGIESFTRLTAFPYGDRIRHNSPLVSYLRVTPHQSASFDMRFDYDPHFHRIRAAGVAGFISYSQLFVAATYFVTNKVDSSSSDSEQLQSQIGYGNPSRGFSGSLSLSYDVTHSLLLNTQTRLNYGWDCCGVAMEMIHFDTKLRNETQFRFSFWLKGLGYFGTLRRPESLF
jgi:LPS-assembly protein